MSNPDYSPKANESSTLSSKPIPRPSRWQWLKGKAVVPLFIILAGVGGMNAYLADQTKRTVNHLSQEVHQQEIVREARLQSVRVNDEAKEEAVESPIETFYNELWTHGLVEEEARHMLEAKLSMLEKHINEGCMEEDKTILRVALSNATDNVSKLKKGSPPDVGKKAITSVYYLEKQVHNRCF